MGTMQFNTELSRDWIRSLASEVLKDTDSKALETEMASRVLLYIDLDGDKWIKVKEIALRVLANSDISDNGKVLAQSIIELAEMNK